MENTHEPLICREQWNVVQKQIKSRKRSMKNGEVQMFAGLLYCSDCGSALSFSTRRRKTKPDGGEYQCWKYMRYGTDYCTSHYITLDQISEVVLEDIRRQARFAKYCRTGYLQLLLEERQARDEEELEQQKENAEQARKRLDQIDAIIRKLLEQNAIGVISDERFAAMMKDYESEQESLKQIIIEYEKIREAHSETVENAERHIEIIEQYTDLKKLNARILNRLIEKIIVHQRGVDEDGCLFQEIEIYYRFIGKTDIDLFDILCPAA